MNSFDTPLVSIGLPVYNEAQWIRRAVESWLSQDYPNFEIIIADNASTDDTADICQEYVARDSRVHLIKNPSDIGPIRNHRLVFDLSRGKYFTWAGGHDHVHTSFLRKTLGVLQNNPSVVMCSLRSEFRDENDIAWRTTKGGFDSRGQPPSERFARLLEHLVSGATANFMYGLYCRNILSTLINNQKKTIGSDVIMLTNLVLLGDVVQLDDILYYRYVSKKRDNTARVKRHIDQFIGGERFQVNVLMPYLGLLFGYLSVIEEHSDSIENKQLMYDAVFKEAQRLDAILKNEFTGFLQMAWQELDSLKNYRQIQHYRVLRILEGLEHARIFGFVTKDSIRLMKFCRNRLDGIPVNESATPSQSLWNRVHGEVSELRLRIRNLKYNGEEK